MKRLTTHVSGVAVEASLVALIVVGLMAGPAFAGKPGGSTTAPSGGITVANGVFAGTSAFQTSASIWAHAKCSQGGAVVYEQWVQADASGRGFFTNGPTPSWTSGDASCWAEAGNWSRSRWRSAGSTTYSVSG